MMPARIPKSCSDAIARKASPRAKAHGELVWLSLTENHWASTVWLFPWDCSSRFQRILAAVDVAADDSDHARLNEKNLELATSLCESEGGELHVVHAWNIPA